MARPVRKNAEALDRARKDVKKTDNAAQLRAALAVLLPAQQGLTLAETANALARNPTWVSRTRNAYLAGKTQFAGPEARGGRRTGLLPEEHELTLVKEAIIRSGGSWQSIRQHLRKLLLKEIDSEPAPSTITAILARAAPKLLSNGNVWELQRWSHKLAHVYLAQKDLESFRRPPVRPR